jgi:hypothetical protein
MPDTTPRLKLPFMSTAQVQKELTFNELAAMVDALMHLAVIDLGLLAPPAAPAEGDTYIIPAGGTGAWAGRAQQIAYYVGGWHYLEAQEGWLAFVKDEHKFYRFDEDAWTPTVVTAIEKFVELTDVAISPAPERNGYVVTYDSAIGKFVLQPVAAKLADLKDVDLTGLADNGVIVWDVETNKFHTMQLPAPGSTTFVGLAETPDSLAGAGGKGIRVNAAATALEYYTIPAAGVTKFTGLSDAPAGYGGQAGRGLRVNADATGLEFYDVGTGGGFPDAPDDGQQYARQNGAWSVVVATGDGGGGGGNTGDAAPHLFWRLRLPVGGGWYAFAIGDLEMRGEAGGPNLCTGGAGFASSTGNGGTVPALFDNNVNTAWLTASFGTDQALSSQEYFVGYSFATPVAVRELKLTARQGTGGELDQLPLTATLEYSDDDTYYFPIHTYTATKPAANGSYVVTLPEIVGDQYVVEAPQDGGLYARQDGDWTEVNSGADASHRFWRISNAMGFTVPGNANFIHSEIRWTDIEGNRIPCVITGTSTVFGGYPIANVNDINPATYGILAGSGPHFINFDFATPKNPETIEFLNGNSSWNLQMIDTFNIGYSDDGVTWTDLKGSFKSPSHDVNVWAVVHIPTTKSRTRLDDLVDVDVDDAITGAVLTFDATARKWIAATGGGSGGGGGGGGGGARAFVTRAITGASAVPWGGATVNVGEPIPGYSMAFTLDTPGSFRVTYNIGYASNHQVRIKPRLNGARFQQILPGDAATSWDFCTFGMYEGGDFGFERSFILDLPAGTHTLDAVYNAMNATNTFTTGEGFILLQEIGGGGGIEEAPEDGTPYARQDGGWTPVVAGDGSTIEDAPDNGMLFARARGAWVAIPEEPKEYINPFPNIRQLDYMNLSVGMALPFTPKIGNYLVFFVGANNGFGVNPGWSETRQFNNGWFNRISFVYKIVDQAMIDAAFLQPVTAGDAGVLFELDVRYVADVLDPLGAVVIATGNGDASAGTYTPTVDTAYLYGGVAREGSWAETNEDAVAPTKITQNSGNRTGGAGYIALATPGTEYALTSEPVDPIEDAPDDDAVYGRRGGTWVVIPDIIPEAPADGRPYVRIDGAWRPISGVTFDD